MAHFGDEFVVHEGSDEEVFEVSRPKVRSAKDPKVTWDEVAVTSLLQHALLAQVHLKRDGDNLDTKWENVVRAMNLRGKFAAVNLSVSQARKKFERYRNNIEKKYGLDKAATRFPENLIIFDDNEALMYDMCREAYQKGLEKEARTAKQAIRGAQLLQCEGAVAGRAGGAVAGSSTTILKMSSAVPVTSGVPLVSTDPSPSVGAAAGGGSLTSPDGQASADMKRSRQTQPPSPSSDDLAEFDCKFYSRMEVKKKRIEAEIMLAKRKEYEELAEMNMQILKEKTEVELIKLEIRRLKAEKELRQLMDGI